LVITSTQRQRQIIAKTPFVFQKNSFGGLLEVLPGHAVSHVSIPPWGTYGRDMRLTYRHDQFGVKYQACGFQLPSISPHDIRIPSVGISDRARNCSTFSLSGVMHETAVPRAKVETTGMGQGKLLALETQFVCVTIGSADSFSVTVPVQAIQGAQLTFVIVVDLATTLEIESKVVVIVWCQCEPAAKAIIASFNRRRPSFTYFNPITVL